MLDLTPFFNLTPLSPQRWRSQAQCPNFRGGLYGGQLLAHALTAVELASPQRPIHTLHTQFLAAGDSQCAIDYRVTRLRQGRSFTHYQINALQKRRLIALMLVGCHQNEAGFSHQEAVPYFPLPSQTSAPNPSGFEVTNWLMDRTDHGPLEYIFAGGARLDHSSTDAGPAYYWLRIRAPLQPHQQLPALAFVSDLGILAGTLTPHPTHLFHREIAPASLNHTLWLHQACADLNQWHLLKISSPWAGHGRGLGQSYLFNAEGILVATASQEGLIRPRSPPAKHG